MDTQQVADQLQKAGFEKEEALHMIHALDETMKNVATTQDINRLEKDIRRSEKATSQDIKHLAKTTSQDIKRLESRIDAMQWTIGIGFTLLGVLMVALRLFA